MIKPNELKLGNFVTNLYGKDVQVTVIDDTVDWAKPIPLTEEWLFKFGFNYKQGFLILGILSCVYVYEEQCYYFYIGKDADTDYKIQYVHQLQNLYFALTGEELQIK